MVRLNRNTLEDKQLEKLFLQLAASISPTDPKRGGNILSELLGPEEKIMMAKRLSAVVLLNEGTSMYKISNILKISKSTVESTNRKLKCGHYKVTLETVSKTKKDYFKFLKTLDIILHLGGRLPHYHGPDRYKGLK